MSDGAETKNTRLVLIRHGESVATKERFVAGYRTCKGLTEHGRRQAEALRDRLARTGEITADILIASNFQRAHETAEIIAPALGHLPIVEDAGVGEHDPGPICDGMKFEEFMERFGEDRDWEDPYADNFAGGETLSAFHYRVATALHGIAETYRGLTVVVACHGGVVDVAMRSFMRLPITGNFTLYTLNTSITEFERTRPFASRTSMARWTLHRYNDTAHLSGVSDPA